MREHKKKKNTNNKTGGLNLIDIEPLTDHQAEVFKSDNNVVLKGSAGTGKTFIATYLALKDIIVHNQYSRLIYIRSAVSTRDIGFLPGNEKDKVEVYEKPYIGIATELFERGDAYEVLKHKDLVQFMPTSFIRGTTINDAVFIVDECQNMSYHELDSVITRVGQNCRVFFCGDFYQSDLKGNGIEDFFKVLKRMNSFDFVEFTINDIVRSEFVKEYLIAKHEIHGNKQLS